ncbi:hypothetical protein [Thauera sp. Sel9]|uniref:hypothetical protein n=1 Tax=Thauera sp. Sel9 TaxID=2974299 RepID=UPI0021E1863E|nr:hypothetical protein [Thauera sp. Sel9]MCV2216129.1 hypothetical protein [Thauera sp. Sel9]
MIDVQAIIRRAHAFGYDMWHTRHGWVLERDHKACTLGKIEAVRNFLNNQVLR